MSTYPYNGYVVIAIDEPIPGLPSHRIYGPFRSRDEAAAEADQLAERTTITSGVLPLRQPAQMKQER